MRVLLQILQFVRRSEYCAATDRQNRFCRHLRTTEKLEAALRDSSAKVRVNVYMLIGSKDVSVPLEDVKENNLNEIVCKQPAWTISRLC